MATTTTTEVTHAVNNYYDKVLLIRALPKLLHAKWAQVRDLPKNNTNVIKFRKYTALAVATTPLTEGVTPTGSQLAVTDITATVLQYGDFITLSDWVQMTTLDPLLTETAKVLGEQAGQTLDIILRDILNAGTNVFYEDATAPKVNAARTDIIAADVISTSGLDIAIRIMKVNNAMKVTEFVNASDGYATTPVNEAYIGIVHPRVSYTLQGLTGFSSIETYVNKIPGGALPGEIGKYKDIRFVETTHAKVFTGGGSGGIDVYSTLIVGRDAYGVSRISGEAMKNIVKPLGSAGSADPLDQRSTSGWKAAFTGKILQQLFMLRIESAVAA